MSRATSTLWPFGNVPQGIQSNYWETTLIGRPSQPITAMDTILQPLATARLNDSTSIFRQNAADFNSVSVLNNPINLSNNPLF